MARTTIAVIAFTSLLLGLAPIAFAQDAWPNYQTEATPEHYLQRGSGWYFAIYKLVLILLTFWCWVRAADWVNRDLFKTGETSKLSATLWNPIIVFSFFAGFLFVITLPIFLLGFPIYLASAIAPVMVYIFRRNAAVREEDRVLTRENLLGALRRNRKPKQVVLPQDEGPPIEFTPAGHDENQKQANLVAARRNSAYILVKELLTDGIYKRADNILLDFTRDSVAVRYQIDGVWHNMEPRDRQTGDNMLVTFKVLANLKPDERRAKQVGTFGFKDPEHKMSCRLTSQGVKTGERVILKLSQIKKTSLTISELGMLPDMENTLKGHLNSSGYVLVSCMPGNGLTTSWNAILSASDRVIRDYVGFADMEHTDTVAENIDFTRFDPSKGETPEKTLRSLALKMPEAFVVPEPSSGTIVNMLCDQILTEGRYAISYAPAKSSSEAIIRMLALKPDRTKFAKSLTAVVYHRLVRRLCDYCKQHYHPSAELLEKLGLKGSTVEYLYREWQAPPPEQLVDARGRPIEPEICSACSGLGYIGQIAIFEMLEVNDTIRQAIVNEPSVEAISAAAKKSGHTTLSAEGIKLVLAGVTSLTELQRVLKQ